MEIIYWLLLAGLFAVIELYTTGFFVISFSIGAIAGLFARFLNLPDSVQWIVFFVTSLICIVFIKLIWGKVKKKMQYPTNIDAIIGEEGVVLEEIIPNDRFGQVRVQGQVWTAFSDEKIKKGTVIKVCSIDGVKLKVEPKNKENVDQNTDQNEQK